MSRTYPVIGKAIYKIFRSIIFSVTLFVVGIYVLSYLLLSIPAFTNALKDRTASELSVLLGSSVEIGDLSIYPFNEIIVKDLSVYDLSGEKCLGVETLGAGIRLWKLLSEGKIEITYGEIIGLEASINQATSDSSLNIQFIIDAFSSKDNKEEKKPFELSLKNVVLRKSKILFARPWLTDKKIGQLDLSEIFVDDLAADITFPEINEKGLIVDLRRLSFNLSGLAKVEKIGLKGELNDKRISIDNFVFEMPGSRLHFPKLIIEKEGTKDLKELLSEKTYTLNITDSYITPKDFSFLSPVLDEFNEPLELTVSGTGNLTQVELEQLRFGRSDVLTFNLKGEIVGLENINKAKGEVSELNLYISNETLQKLSTNMKMPSHDVKHLVEHIGNFSLTGEGAFSMSDIKVDGNLDIISDAFELTAEGSVENFLGNNLIVDGEVNVKDLKIQMLFPKIPIENISANLIAEGALKEKNNPQGMLSLVVDNFEFRGKEFDGLSLNISKEENLISGDLLMNNEIAAVDAEFTGNIEPEEKSLDLKLNLENFNISELTNLKRYQDYLLSGEINLTCSLNSEENFSGELNLDKFSFISPDLHKNLKLHKLNVKASSNENLQNVVIKSDWVDTRVEGKYKIKELPAELTSLVESVVPVLFNIKQEQEKEFTTDLEFDIVIKNNNAVPEFFNLPIKLLVPVTIGGSIESETQTATLTLNAPYLQQGKDKLIYDTRFVASVDGAGGVFDGLIETNLPVKKGDLNLNVNLYGRDNTISTDLHWMNTENNDFKGHLQLDTQLSKNYLTSKPEVTVDILPSVLQMGSSDWTVSKSRLTYSDKLATIEGLKIRNGDQFIEIEGVASPEYSDVVKVSLADIDVDYVFDMLQINYVTFGGTATGEIAGHSLFGSDPVAETESFIIKDFTYNGCGLGTCLATSRWNNEEKEIEITADISLDGKRIVYGNGGIWLGRDSLCFDIDAYKVPVDFVQPFMAVFSSHVGGEATGGVRLFGNFHDIDMTGKIFADSIAVKLDYTNTIYHGSDSVILTPGKIEIPHFRLYDRNNNSALLTGELTHRYFHDPAFTFRLNDAHDFLCYDTNSDLNPDWYGTFYGTGSAFLRGIPGTTDISADMTVGGNSVFTFVLNDTEYARDYQFLTFSNKKAEIEKIDAPLTVDDFKEMLKKRMAEDTGSLSRFGIDIRATVTPQVLFTLIMDPAAGDKITARGKGAMQVKYESDDDEMMMYGKYEIEEGNYNFSLQDIILRDFKIKEGSYITFNGNPLAADLDISATYRVNTNLSDLDKSFSTDRDLNRTNVPVDAVLSVTGLMTQPDITFDIELPTLTQDVERKVKSIISTDDMMNRQIIYLLALNRFYTPEYMGAGGNGGELAAVASSTISSQLSNILGQLTDKFSVSPSFRSDKGDFSDIEVDVALSSRLLNNRLLINGNFGYRDRSTSSTTFVGDFDVEYLLSKNGNLRLKAYNHFNDQNYYLREALTTQGLGVVYRRDFDNWFTFLKKRKKENTVNDSSVSENTNDRSQDNIQEEIKEEHGSEN